MAHQPGHTDRAWYDPRGWADTWQSDRLFNLPEDSPFYEILHGMAQPDPSRTFGIPEGAPFREAVSGMVGNLNYGMPQQMPNLAPAVLGPQAARGAVDLAQWGVTPRGPSAEQLVEPPARGPISGPSIWGPGVMSPPPEWQQEIAALQQQQAAGYQPPGPPTIHGARDIAWEAGREDRLDDIYETLYGTMKTHADEELERSTGRYEEPAYTSARDTYLDAIGGQSIYDQTLTYLDDIETRLMSDIEAFETLKQQGITGAAEAQVEALNNMERVRTERLNAEEGSLLTRLGELEDERAIHEAESLAAIEERSADALTRSEGFRTGAEGRLTDLGVDAETLPRGEMSEILASQGVRSANLSQQLADIEAARATDREMGLRRGFSDTRTRLADAASAGRASAREMERASLQTLAETVLQAQQQTGMATLTGGYDAFLGQAARDAKRAEAAWNIESGQVAALIGADTRHADALHEIDLMRINRQISEEEENELKELEAEKTKRAVVWLSILEQDPTNPAALAGLGDLYDSPQFAQNAMSLFDARREDEQLVDETSAIVQLLWPQISQDLPGVDAAAVTLAMLNGQYELDLADLFQVNAQDLPLSLEEWNAFLSENRAVAEVFPAEELPAFLAHDIASTG